MRAMVETWRSAMLEKGWQASDCEPNRKIPSEPATTEDEIRRSIMLQIPRLTTPTDTREVSREPVRATDRVPFESTFD
jgi:hypothetical protein